MSAQDSYSSPGRQAEILHIDVGRGEFSRSLQGLQELARDPSMDYLLLVECRYFSSV